MTVHLEFEGIRCFPARQNAALRPLTILVGENSSGKTTFLALCQIATALTGGPEQALPFNKPPFLLGAFDQIASYRRGRAGRLRSFSIGVRAGCEALVQEVEARFESRDGQPSLTQWTVRSGEVAMHIVAQGEPGVFTSTMPRRPGDEEVEDKNAHWAEALLGFPLKHRPGVSRGVPLKDLLKVSGVHTEIEALRRSLETIRLGLGDGAYGFAPIRTSPQRTYDPVSAEPRPEGSHVPMLLARLSRAAANRQWPALRTALGEFGARAGLFERIEVLTKGKKESDPFQIAVKSGGPAFNLVDVGYGVSQALPILVDTILRASKNQLFLLQQPEVHLHPRAQAELGSFFARQAGRRGRFVIETHSDYLVDRVRMEVRQGRLRPEDVSLLYFERQKTGATIYNLELDRSGTIVNPPPGYRRFFLEEERNLLGV
jgi:hypothetical protein